MRAYGGRDYECMDEAADMIERMSGHLHRLLHTVPSEKREPSTAQEWYEQFGPGKQATPSARGPLVEGDLATQRALHDKKERSQLVQRLADELRNGWVSLVIGEEAATELERLEDLANMLGQAALSAIGAPGWIATKDRLPSDHEYYLCFWHFAGDDSEGDFAVGYYGMDKKWALHAGQVKDAIVTHWMQLPGAPTDGKGDK